MNKKTIGLLFSGGTKSSLILNKYLKEGKIVHAIYIKSGYSYEYTELMYARRTISYLNVMYPNQVVFKIIDVSSLSQKSLGIVSNQKDNIIPLRPMTLATIASLYIAQNNIDILGIGSQESPEYSDGTTKYIDSLEDLIKKGLGNKNFKIDKPFFYLTKKEIIENYYEEKLFEYDFIFSCVNPKDNKKCGTCYKCKNLEEVLKK
jgi:7-cyano-7-deazaguanine synthase